MVNQRPKSSSFYFLCLTIALLMIPATSYGQSRTWTSADGKKKIQATFISADNGKVTIKRDNGKQLTVSLSKFSEADRAFVESQLDGLSLIHI